MRKWASIPKAVPEIMSLVIRQACDGTHFHTSHHTLGGACLTDMNAVTPSWLGRFSLQGARRWCSFWGSGPKAGSAGRGTVTNEKTTSWSPFSSSKNRWGNVVDKICIVKKAVQALGIFPFHFPGTSVALMTTSQDLTRILHPSKGFERGPDSWHLFCC